MARKSGLGKGLDALFVDNSPSQESDTVTLKTSEIEPNKNQPRKVFDENALAALAESIRQHGIIQPLVVRPLPGGMYQIVAGERRWRASRMLGLSELPVVIREMDDKQVMEIALIENLQREDLNPIEEALGFRQLMDEFSLTQDEVAVRVGRSRPAIANALRLLQLPDEVLEMVQDGALSAGQAKTILAFGDEQEMIRVSRETLKHGFTVRELEKRAQKGQGGGQKKQARSRETYYDEMEIALRDALSRTIKIDVKGNKGTLHIDFYNKEELADLAHRLSDTNNETR